MLLRKSETALSDSQFYSLSLEPAGESHLSTVRHRLLGVSYQVGERFVNQSAIGLDRRQRWIELVLDLDLFRIHTTAQLFQQLVNVEIAQLQLLGPHEPQ